MEEGPYSIRKHIQGVLSWLDNEDALKKLDAGDVSLLKEKLTPLTKEERKPERNPYVLLRYEYNGYYGSFKKKYLVPLVDFVIIALANPTFCYHDEVGKHSEVEAAADEFSVQFADEAILEKYYGTSYEVWNLDGDYAPFYSEEAKEELRRVFAEETPAYSVDQDDVPVPQDFIPLIERVLEKYPMECTLVWENAVDTGKKMWNGKPDLLDISIEFTDAREAALFVATAPNIDYFTWRKKDRLYPVHISSLKNVQPFFEDDTVGTKSRKLWTPDAHQWDQLQKECAPRAPWDEMLSAAKSVMRQKRLKL